MTSVNLGGQGPDLTEDKNMRVAKLGKHDGKEFDLIVESIGVYKPPEGTAGWNNVYNYFGYISVTAPSSPQFKFRLVETGTYIPMPLPKFYFTFFDLDTGNPNVTGAGREMVTVRGHSAYWAGPNTELNITELGNGSTSFEATVFGTRADNPKDPMQMTELAQNRAITLEFTNTAEFYASYDVSPGAMTIGRDVFFAGKSQLATIPCEPKADPRRRSRSGARRPGGPAPLGKPDPTFPPDIGYGLLQKLSNEK